MEEAEDDHLPSMETAAMVGRWKARAVRKMRFAASPTRQRAGALSKNPHQV